jgi:hypothetical protein
MSVSGISSYSNNYHASNAQGASSQRGSDFKNLVQSLKSGDLSGAQQAYAALAQALPANASSSSNGQAGTFSTDLQAIGKALQSGDLSGAQQALSKLQQDGKAIQQAHGAHHHHHAGSAASTASATTATTTDTTTTAASTPATSIDIKV